MEEAMPTTQIELNAQTVFRREELNEVLLMVYNVLNRALKDGADTLRVEAGRFTWGSDQTALGEFRFARIPHPEVFPQALATIRSRDPLVAQHFQPEEELGERQQYRII
jgi:hypothetical protein